MIKFNKALFLVDTDVIYTMVPAEVLRQLKVEPEAKRCFKLADGKVRQLPVGETRIRVEGVEVSALVVLGKGDSTLRSYHLKINRTSGRPGYW